MIVRRNVAAMLVVVALGGGCASARPGPGELLNAYANALRDGRYPEAYTLLSVETRRAITLDEFERLARENPEEIRETLRVLEQVDSTAPVTARMELSAGETLTLTEEGGQWRLDPTVLDFYGQRTPRQALRSFARALHNRRFDVLLRFVPRRMAERLTAEQLQQAWTVGPQSADVERMLTELRTALDRNMPIEVLGERASMQYGTRGQLLAQLLREDGVWKIEDPD